MSSAITAPSFPFCAAARLTSAARVTQGLLRWRIFCKSVPRSCPHELFRQEDGARASKLPKDSLNLDRLVVTEKHNTATSSGSKMLATYGSDDAPQVAINRAQNARFAAEPGFRGAQSNWSNWCLDNSQIVWSNGCKLFPDDRTHPRFWQCALARTTWHSWFRVPRVVLMVRCTLQELMLPLAR